jgi:hypothetical protein
VIRAYAGDARRGARRIVRREGLTYAELFFGSSQLRHRRAYRRLAALGDDSRTYPFRVEAAREILRLADEDRPRLRRLAALQIAKANAEEVLRPRDRNPPFTGPAALRRAIRTGDLVPLPADPRGLGFRVDPDMGELGRRLRVPRRLYRALRPEALATLLYVAKEVRRVTGRGTLTVTSTVRDLPYQRLLAGVNAEATRGFSLHTAGVAIDVARGGPRGREAALRAVLERLRALGVGDWVEEPTALHFTVGPEGRRFLPLLRAIPPEAGRGAPAAGTGY